MIDHIGLAVSDIEASRRFYEAALEPLGVSLLMTITPEMTGGDGVSLGFGRDDKPFFWIGNGQKAGAEPHIAFSASKREQVNAFHVAAVAAGGRDNGLPGLRPHYHPDYYGAFVLSPDGANIEAVCHAPA